MITKQWFENIRFLENNSIHIINKKKPVDCSDILNKKIKTIIIKNNGQIELEIENSNTSSVPTATQSYADQLAEIINAMPICYRTPMKIIDWLHAISCLENGTIYIDCDKMNVPYVLNYPEINNKIIDSIAILCDGSIRISTKKVNNNAQNKNTRKHRQISI